MSTGREKGKKKDKNQRVDSRRRGRKRATVRWGGNAITHLLPYVRREISSL